MPTPLSGRLGLPEQIPLKATMSRPPTPFAPTRQDGASISGNSVEASGDDKGWRLMYLPTCLCLLAYALRIHQLDKLSLWYDEGWSVHLARLLPWRALPQIMGSGHTHPPLYYLLLGAWQAVAGPSEFGVRFLSLGFGTLLVAMGYRLAREYPGNCCAPSSSRLHRSSRLAHPTGLIAALLLAVSPPQIVYAQEARSYTLFALEYAVLIFLAPRFLRRPWRVRLADWAVLILAEALALYTHYFAVVLLAYLGCVTLGSLIWHRRWATLRRWAAAQIVVGVLYLPWVQTAFHQLGGHDRPDMQALPLGSFLGLVWRFYFSGLSWAASRYPYLVQAALALALLAAASFLINVLLRRAGQWDWLLLGFFVLPLSAVFLIEQMRPGLHPRYAFMLSVPLQMLLARQIALWLSNNTAQKLVGIGLGGATLLTLALGLLAMDREHDKDDVRALAAHLTAEATAGDLILFDYEDFAFEYYYQGEAPVLYLEGYGPPEPLQRRILDEASGRQRVFLVTWYTGHTDRREFYPFLLELNGDLESESAFPGLRLREYGLHEHVRAGTPVAVSADYGSFRLVGAFRESPVPSDGAVIAALRWQLEKPVDASYKAAVILKDDRGREIARTDSPLVNNRGRPSEEWAVGTQSENYYVIPIPLGTPPLIHSLHVALYAEDVLAKGGEPLDLLSETGAPSGKHFELGSVTLSVPSIPQRDAYRTRDRMMLEPVEQQMATGLRLEATKLGQTVVRPGGPIPVLLLWSATMDQLPDYRPAIELLSETLADDGEVLAQQQGAPAGGQYPTRLWRKGELVLDRRELMIDPQTSATGEATLEVQVGDGESLALAAVTMVEAPEHVFEPPAVQHEVYARFGETAELVGYDLPVAGTAYRGIGSEAIPLVLYWRAIGEGSSSTSYTVFVHLLSHGGERLVAQHDGPPAEGRRPTTSWIRGEIVTDPHSLHWWEEYAGTCPIEVGLYDPATSERLPVYDRRGNRLPNDRLILDQSVTCAASDGG